MRPMKPPTAEGFHGEEQEAEELGWSLPTLRLNRRKGIGPEFIRQGRRVLYRDGGAARWLESLFQEQARARSQPVKRGRPRKARGTTDRPAPSPIAARSSE
jgi:hypothetical protein